MGRITVLSPLHIGSGEEYFTITLHNNKRYPLEVMLDTVENKVDLLDLTSLNKLTNKSIVSQMPKDEFFRMFKINATKVNESKALYSVNPMHSIKAGNVYECVKTFNKLYIPGSSLKGYIISMMWYSILKDNPDIRKYIFDNLNSWNSINNRISALQNMLIVRDIIFDSNIPSLFEAKSFGKSSPRYPNGVDIPIGILECITPNTPLKEENIEIIVNITNSSIQIANQIKNTCIQSLKVLKEKGKISEDQMDKETKIINQIFDHLKDIKLWFPTVNNEVVKENINREIEFLKKINNNKFVKDDIIYFYEELLNKIKDGKIIIRLGKHTNYYYKSIGPVFGEDFTKKYKDLFTPTTGKNQKKKTDPSIGTINVLKSQTERFDSVLGFIEIEL